MSTEANIQAILNKQRVDKFRLVLSLPNILRDDDSSDWSLISNDFVNGDSLQYSLYATTLPEVNIPAVPVGVMGQTVKVTSQVREPYQPITCRYAIDNRFRNYWVLWKWMTKINDPIHSGMVDKLCADDTHLNIKTGQAYWDYQTRITISPLDEYNKAMCEFVFNNAFITKLGGINFTYQESTEVNGEFTFEFGQMDFNLLGCAATIS